MAEPNRNRLKYVLDRVPAGFLVDSQWLGAHDVAKSSASNYDRDGWLERVARGVYRRPYPGKPAGNVVEWKMAVLSAQWIMGYDFHVGGMSALSLEGHNHYLGLGRSADVATSGPANSRRTRSAPVLQKISAGRSRITRGAPSWRSSASSAFSIAALCRA